MDQLVIRRRPLSWVIGAGCLVLSALTLSTLLLAVGLGILTWELSMSILDRGRRRTDPGRVHRPFDHVAPRQVARGIIGGAGGGVLGIGILAMAINPYSAGLVVLPGIIALIVSFSLGPRPGRDRQAARAKGCWPAGFVTLVVTWIVFANTLGQEFFKGLDGIGK